MPKPNKSSAAGATVQSIAELANVSAGAVSAVLNNRHIERRISLKTAERIRAAARQLGYMPNIGARQMRGGSAKKAVVVALITSLEAPVAVTSHIIALIRNLRESEGIDFSLSLTVEMFEAGKLHELPGILTGSSFNAAILTNTTPEDDQFLSRNHVPYPIVVLNRNVPGYACTIDHQNLGGMAADTLCGMGRTRMAVLHGRPMTQAIQTRLHSFSKTASQNLGRCPAEIVANGLSEEAAYVAVKEWLKGENRMDALYCVTDSLAIGAYHAMKEAGLRVPQDVAVVGVGDNDSSPYLDPPLSTVGADHDYVTGSIGKLLLDQLLSPVEYVPQVIEIPAKTNLRRSTLH